MTASTHDPETEFSFPAPHLTAARRASHARPPCRRPWSRSRRTATPRARDLLPRGLLRRPGLGAPLLCAALVPLTADAQTVPADWAAKPDAVKPGQSFRLLFVTSGNTHFPSPAAISSSTTPLRRRRQTWIPHSRMLYRADSTGPIPTRRFFPPPRRTPGSTPVPTPMRTSLSTGWTATRSPATMPAS